MSRSENLSGKLKQMRNQMAARRATMTRAATAFVSQPEPRTIGSFAKGRQLTAGNYLFSGHLVQKPGASLWELDPPDDGFLQEIHGFTWLDDLAAAGDLPARQAAQSWLWDWIDTFGRGRGPGWSPDLTGRRLIRWINHAIFLLNGREKEQSNAFYQSLAQQTHFLAARWYASAPGLPRFEALTGLIYAGLALEGMERYIPQAAKALDQQCREQIGIEGGLPTRNPEDLLDVFTLLTWASVALEDSDREPSDAHAAAIERIGPTLRSLRHADGGLARFHGGGRGLDGRLDSALAASGVRGRKADGLAMGFARLSGGRTSIIVDAAQPPFGQASGNAHASTLAFELTSGRRPLVVNCGSGVSFGKDWRRAGRATPSHSTLIVSGQSSSRLGTSGPRQNWLMDVPTNVPVSVSQMHDGYKFEGGHNGYLKTFGLTHIRKLEVTFSGSGVVGEDSLQALDGVAHAQLDRVMDQTGLQGIPFDIRFHLHPDVDTSLDMGGSAVSLALKSGEIWIFRSEGPVGIRVEPSVYLEKNRLKPRATKQIVLSGRAMEYATRIRWSFAKPENSPVGLRDLVEDEAIEDPANT